MFAEEFVQYASESSGDPSHQDYITEQIIRCPGLKIDLIVLRCSSLFIRYGPVNAPHQ